MIHRRTILKSLVIRHLFPMGMPLMSGIDIMAGVAIAIANPLTREFVVSLRVVFGLLPAFIAIGITLDSYTVISVLVAALKRFGVGRTRRKCQAGHGDSGCTCQEFPAVRYAHVLSFLFAFCNQRTFGSSVPRVPSSGTHDGVPPN